jgi:hypothetical protein
MHHLIFVKTMVFFLKFTIYASPIAQVYAPTNQVRNPLICSSFATNTYIILPNLDIGVFNFLFGWHRFLFMLRSPKSNHQHRMLQGVERSPNALSFFRTTLAIHCGDPNKPDLTIRLVFLVQWSRYTRSYPLYRLHTVSTIYLVMLSQ